MYPYFLAYGDWFQPSLPDQVNALFYHDFSSLLEAINQAKSMPEKEIAKMRMAAQSYYREHLNPANVAASVRVLIQREQLRMIYINHEDCSTLSQAGEESALKGNRSFWPLL